MKGNPMTDPSKPKKPKKSKTVSTPAPQTEPRDVKMASIAIGGVFNNAVLAVDFCSDSHGELNIEKTVLEIWTKIRNIHDGDLRDVETLLVAQAIALDAMFLSLARRSRANMGQHMDATDRYMRLALKAQGQCRATLETLANIKNPSVVFARQANIAHGPQQVNNNITIDKDTQAHTPAPAKKSKTVKNELLEHHDDQRMDTRTPPKTGRRNPAMATLDKINRPPQP